MGLAARRGPTGCQVSPPPTKKKGGKETIPDYSRLCISFHSVFLSGGAGFLSKVSLCALIDTQELSQSTSSLALLKDRSGRGGGGAQGDDPFSRRKRKPIGQTLYSWWRWGWGWGAVTLEPENQQVSLNRPPHL